MTAQEILDEIRPLGTEGYKKVIMNHGATEPIFGVKISDLKIIQKRVKKNYQLALDLYESGVYDAMYLAGLIADDMKMTRADLHRWVKGAYCYGLAEYTVAWVAAEGRFGQEVALEWIDSKKDLTSAAGWSTLSCLAAIRPDSELDFDLYQSLLDRVARTIKDQPNRTRYTMNGFMIAVGAYIEPIAPLAIQTAKQVGTVTVDMGGTSCKVPDSLESIAKVHKRGPFKKRKTVKC